MPPWTAPQGQDPGHSVPMTKVKISCLWMCLSRVISKGLSELILASIGNFSSACQSDTNHTQGPMSPKRLFSAGWVEAP